MHAPAPVGEDSSGRQAGEASRAGSRVGRGCVQPPKLHVCIDSVHTPYMTSSVPYGRGSDDRGYRNRQTGRRNACSDVYNG
jgi:hypothetical protein